MGARTVSVPLALPLLAALTPPPWDVRIVDEHLGPQPDGPLADLVGITAMISNIHRALQVADAWRARGVPVVMGGPQVTVAPEQARPHVDALVLGEAEGVWGQVLSDALAHRLQPTYRSEAPVPYTRSPAPRWDLVDTRHVLQCTVQVSRGCPFACDFCLVPKILGGRQRYRDLDDVVAELAALPIRQVSFADDNLTANKRYARDLMERMIPLHLSWSCQASLDTACDEDLLALMARAGCQSVLIGFESLSPEALAEARKTANQVDRYSRAIRNVQRAGIHVVASFVVGFESDTAATFDHLEAFTREHDLCYVMVNALAAYPGTDLHRRMAAQHRLTGVENRFADGIFPTIRYRHLAPSQMYEGALACLHRIYSLEAMTEKGTRLLGNGAFTRPPPAPPTPWIRLRATLFVLRRFLLTRDAGRRRLLVALLRLAGSGAAHLAQVIPFLLFVESLRAWLAHADAHREEVLTRIREGDDRPWNPDSDDPPPPCTSRADGAYQEPPAHGLPTAP